MTPPTHPIDLDAIDAYMADHALGPAGEYIAPLVAECRRLRAALVAARADERRRVAVWLRALAHNTPSGDGAVWRLDVVAATLEGLDDDLLPVMS